MEARLAGRFRDGLPAALIGPSASGKSVLLREAVGRFYGTAEHLWVDLADPAATVFGVLGNLASIRMSSPYCVVLDDAQSSPVVADQVLTSMGLLRLSGLNWVAAAWPSAAELLERFAGSEGMVFTDAGDLCRRIIGSVEAPGSAIEEMLGLANGNALVAELAVGAFRDQGVVPKVSDLASGVFSSLVGERDLGATELETLRELSCLGMFEIDADAAILSALRRQSIDPLVASGVCRRNGQYVYFGHRTVARLLVHHLDAHALVGEHMSPVRVAVNYLRDAGPAQTKVTLDRLDLIAIAGSDDQFGAAFLAQCWGALNVLTRHLSRQVAEDATWGDNVASAVFAGEAFAEVGMLDDWRECAKYIRSRWLVSDEDKLPTHTAGITNESDDFKSIQQRMIEEDAEDPDPNWTLGNETDIDRFHRTWVLGLLLGFEGKALERDAERLRHLVRMADLSVEPGGSFYPSRAPWVTARVLIGLAAAGRTVQVSDTATLAASWLRTRPPLGPARLGGIWRSGTGTWNTDLQITALVLLSLGRSGADPSDRVVRSGLQTLRAGRSEWYRPGKEIDAAQALEAVLVLGSQWREHESELRSLLQWCQDTRSWRETRALASVIQDESSKVPAVASALIGIIWETVRAELPLLLQGLVGEGDTGADANFEAQMIRSERALGEIRRHIEAELTQRRQVVARGGAAPGIRKAYEDWASKLAVADVLRDECTRVRSDLNQPAFEELSRRIDALGLDVLSEAYQPLMGGRD